MISMVVRAFSHSGGLKAGTPFATASVPVIAEQPSANARMRRSSPKVSAGTCSGVTPVTWGGMPSSVRTTPAPIITRALTRKM